MGGHSYYKEKASDLQVLQMFDQGLYVCDIAEGVIRRRNGSLLKCYAGNDEGHRFVRLYGLGFQRVTSVHRIVWIIGSRSAIPEGWEIHHRNLDCTDNRWCNLFCLHPADHRKLHQGVVDDLIENDIPF